MQRTTFVSIHSTTPLKNNILGLDAETNLLKMMPLLYFLPNIHPPTTRVISNRRAAVKIPAITTPWPAEDQSKQRLYMEGQLLFKYVVYSVASHNGTKTFVKTYLEGGWSI